MPEPSNPLLLGMAGVVVFSQLLVLYVPFLQTFFNTVPLSSSDLIVCATLGSIVFIAIEVEKWWTRRAVSHLPGPASSPERLTDG